MSDTLNAIDNLPDISFIDGLTLQDVQYQLIADYQNRYKELTGKTIHLAKGDPNRIILLANAQALYQALQCIDKAAKMNYLKYAYGDYLENLAAFKNTPKLEPQKAHVYVRWSLAGARLAATSIPAGTRVTADWKIFFETQEYNEIPAGETETVLEMVCTTTGEDGNDFAPGEINEMVDPLPFIAEVYNTTVSDGGSGEETDQSLAERAYLAPSGYSTAGPADAYIYHAMAYDANIGDVRADTPSPGVVDIRFIMADGSLPSEAEITGLQNYLTEADRKPLTDTVQVGAPSAVNYNIGVTYYINKSDQESALAIQEAAETAMEEYKSWQSSKIGRDINPDELLGRLKKAGIKRAAITSPAYTALTAKQIASCTAASLIYGGIEDD